MSIKLPIMIKILVKVTKIKLSYQLSGLTEIEFEWDQQLSIILNAISFRQKWKRKEPKPVCDVN